MGVDQLLVDSINLYLSRDGYKLEVATVISDKNVYAAVRALNPATAATADAKRIADDMSSDYVMGQVTRMRESIDRDPALAIGSAKEFVETVAKGILREKKVPLSGSENFPSLVNLVRRNLNLSVSPTMNNSLKGVLSGLGNIIQGVAEIRGDLGTGHGAVPETPRPDPAMARLAVGMATTLGVFLYETYQNQKGTSSSSPQPIMQEDKEIPF